MTREEAYEILKTGICLICAHGCKNMDDCDISYCDIRNAVKTLIEEPCSDTISRQAAQEGLNHLMDSDGFRDSVGYVQKSLVRKMLVNLPPVQPKLTECEDAISRDDALKALAYDIESFEFKSGVSKHMNEIANLLNTIYEIQSDNIKALPSVNPKLTESEDKE